MEIALTPELERRIAETVKAGVYADPSEAVRAGLRLLFDDESRHERLRAAIGKGLSELDRGEVIDGETVLAEINQRLDQRRGT